MQVGEELIQAYISSPFPPLVCRIHLEETDFLCATTVQPTPMTPKAQNPCYPRATASQEF